MKFLTIAALCAISLLTLLSESHAQSADLGKIAVIDTDLFLAEKTGITKYLKASKGLETEFAPLQSELQTMGAKLAALNKDIETFRSQAASGTVPVNESAARAKVDEAEVLSRSIKFKQEDAQARFNNRREKVLGPVMMDIGKALTEFAKTKGYALIFDMAKDREGILVAIGNPKADVTTEFIAYYNARP